MRREYFTATASPPHNSQPPILSLRRHPASQPAKIVSSSAASSSQRSRNKIPRSVEQSPHGPGRQEGGRRVAGIPRGGLHVHRHIQKGKMTRSPCLARTLPCPIETNIAVGQQVKLFTDVTLVIGEAHLPAHRVVLSACSDYFQRTLTK